MAERIILHVFLAPNGPRKGSIGVLIVAPYSVLFRPSARPTSPYLTRTVHSTGQRVYEGIYEGELTLGPQAYT